MTGPPRVTGASLSVAFVVDQMTTGGTELHAARLATHLAHHGVRVIVAHLQPDGPLVTRYRDTGLPTRAFPFRGFASRSFHQAGRAFRSWLAEQGVALVHAHDIYTNVFAARWATIPLVVSRRWWTMPYSRSLRLANRWASARAAAVVTNSEHLARYLAARHLRLAPRLRSIPSLLEEDYFRPALPHLRPALRAQMGFAPHDIVVAIMARLDPVKDHASLLEAMAILRDRAPRLALAVVGDGPERARLVHLASRLGLTDRVRFLGEWPRLPSPYVACDLAVLCSRSEGMPNTVLEALAVGLPVVATAVGGVPEIVVHGETGLLVPPGDPSALAGALTQLATDRDTARRLAEAGQTMVRQRHTTESVLPHWLALYESVAPHQRS